MRTSLLSAILLLSGIGTGGCKHQHLTIRPQDPTVTCPSGVKLEGSTDCAGLDAALDRCATALGAAGLTVHLPATVDVDVDIGPAFNHAYGGTSSERLDNVLLPDDHWRGDNALCHEIVHLSLRGSSASEMAHTLPDWPLAYDVAIEAAR